MSKKVQMDEVRRDAVLKEVVEMYIKNNGQMPTSRMIKKNSFISEAEVNLLRKMGLVAEGRIRRMAEEETGVKFATAKERRQVRPMQEEEKKQEVEEMTEVTEVMKVTETAVVEKAHRGRGHGLTTEEVLADLKALVERMGRIPSQMEVMDVENGAKFSYATYVKKLGPKSEWARILGLEEPKPVEEPANVTVEEPKAEPATELKPEPVEPAKEAKAEEFETVEISGLSMKIPKALKGKITVTIRL